MSETSGRTLLQMFLAEESSDRSRAELLEAIGRPIPYVDEVIFNRWEVIIDKRDRTVTIVDVLDGSRSGTQRLSIDEFNAAVSAETG